MGIPVSVDLPGVGENFHDHPLVIGPFGRMTEPGPDPRGNMTEVGLFWGSVPGMPVPDLEICLVHRAPFGNAFFANVVNRLQTGQPIQPVTQLVDPHVILSLPGLVRPLSRGWVRLRSENPTVGRVEKQVIGRVLIRSAAATGAWVLIHHERHNSPYATTVWLLAPRRDRSQIPAPYRTIFSRFWHIYCHGSLP
jgi:hypothetical protein